MANWNEIRSDVSKAAKTAIKKTGELADSASLRFNLKKIEIRLHSAYERLGRLTYKQLKSEQSQAEQISETIATIDSLRAEAATIKKKIEEAKAAKEEEKQDAADADTTTEE